MNLRCPITGCSNQREAARYAMCVDCWRFVPIPLRGRIRGYWGEIKSAAADGSSERQRNAAIGLAAAKREAVDFVEQSRSERQAA